MSFLPICILNATPVQLQASTIHLPCFQLDLSAARSRAELTHLSPEPFSGAIIDQGTLALSQCSNDEVIKSLRNPQRTQHPTTAAVLPWVHRHQPCSSPLGNLQLCFVGFNWCTGSLRAAAEALNQHMEKVSSLNSRWYFSNRFLSYIYQKICTPGAFFQKLFPSNFAYVHRRNTLNKPAPLSVCFSGCYCNELSFFSHSCLPMDFLCFLQGI